MTYTKQEIFFKKESSWGTAVSPAATTVATDVIGQTKDFSYRLENSTSIENNASSVVPLYRTQGNMAVTGSYSFNYINAMPFVLILGGVKATNPVEGEAPYNWEIKPADELPSFTASYFASGTNDILTQLAGCYATSLDFRLGLSGGASGTLNFIAKSKKDTAYTKPTTITLPSSEPIDSIGTQISIGALDNIAYLTEINFSINRTAKINYTLSKRTGTQNVVGKYGAISGSISAWVEDSATAKELEDLVTGKTKDIGDCVPEQDISITWLPPCNGVGVTTGKIEIKIKKATLQSAEMSFPLNEGIAYNIPFVAKYIDKIDWKSPTTVESSGW